MSALGKKIKYHSILSRRGRERLQQAVRRFDIFTTIMAFLLILAMIVCNSHPYELGANRPDGFAAWLLLFLAYIPLEIVGLATWLLGLQNSALVHMLVEQHQTLALGIFDLAMLLAVWLVVHFYCSRRFGANFIRTATMIMTILVAWGTFQLGCMGAVVVWNRGGFAPLHRHLHRVAEPQRVILVVPDKSGPSLAPSPQPR